MESRTHTGARRLVTSYEEYGKAEGAVDYLSDDGFPVEELSIVAEDLRLVERVTGRRDRAQVVLGSATTGALVGASVGFLLGLFSVVDPLTSGLALAFWGALAGATVGLVLGFLTYWLGDGRRDFSSVPGIEAGRYEVLATTDDLADEARRRLGVRPV